jgi:hypothetical protein
MYSLYKNENTIFKSAVLDRQHREKGTKVERRKIEQMKQIEL